MIAKSMSSSSSSSQCEAEAPSNSSTPVRKQQQQEEQVQEHAKNYQQDEGALPSTVAPMFHMIFRQVPCLRPVLKLLYRLRSMIARPFNAPLLPAWLVTAVPYAAHVATVGQCLLLLPLAMFLSKGAHYTFAHPDLHAVGKEATYAIYWAFLTASKSNSIFALVLGVPFERLIAVHHYVASLVAVVLGCFHVHVAFTYGSTDRYSEYSQVGERTNLTRYLLDGSTNISGTVLLGALLLLLLTSQFAILRRWLFQLWYMLHMTLGVATLVGLFWHDVSSAYFVTYWWGLDLAVRYIVMAAWQYRGTATVRYIGDRQAHEAAVELRMVKPTDFDYQAGQFVQVCLPAVSLTEFHPITISSAPHENELTLHIRGLGDWSRRLVEMVANGKESLQVCMEGPYGACAVELDQDKTQYPMVLLVSGGIGVTPCQSIGKSLLHQHTQQGRNLEYLRFVWAVRDLQMVHDMPPLGLVSNTRTSQTEPKGRKSPLMTIRDELLAETKRLESRKGNSPQRGGGPYSTNVFASSQDNQTTDHIHMAHRNNISSDDSVEVLSHQDHCQKATSASPSTATVQVDVYCTRKITSGDVEIGTASSSSYDVHQGRPDLDEILLEMKEIALENGVSHVAVIGCGPTAMMRTLQQGCLAHSDSLLGCGAEGVFFDLHTEMFEF